MKTDLSTIRLTELPGLLRLVFTLFILMILVAYGVSMINLYMTYNLTDGKPGLTVDDLRRAFYGKRNQTLLASKIDGGSMSQFLPFPGEKEAILSWLQDGATREGYENVKQIFEDRCVTCHQPKRLMWKRPLTTYDFVKKVAVVDRGEPFGLWARVAHTHLMSLAVVFFCLSVIFSFCGVKQKYKAIFMPFPFVALFLDFGARALIKYVPALVYVMILTGALMGMSILVLTLAPLYEMWFRGRKSAG